MVKTAKKPEPAPAGERMIDSSQYNTVTYVDPETGKTKTSRGSCDAVALALLTVKKSDYDGVAKANDLSEKFNREYPNAGQMAMALSNMLRAKVKRGEPVKIGEHTVKKLDQVIKLPKPPVVTKDKAPKAA